MPRLRRARAPAQFTLPQSRPQGKLEVQSTKRAAPSRPNLSHLPYQAPLCPQAHCLSPTGNCQGPPPRRQKLKLPDDWTQWGQAFKEPPSLLGHQQAGRAALHIHDIHYTHHTSPTTANFFQDNHNTDSNMPGPVLGTSMTSLNSLNILWRGTSVISDQ